jgi:hypothetical protein
MITAPKRSAVALDAVDWLGGESKIKVTTRAVDPPRMSCSCNMDVAITLLQL